MSPLHLEVNTMKLTGKEQEIIDAIDRITNNLPTGDSTCIDLEVDVYNMFSFIGEQTAACADQQELIRGELKTLNQNFENLNSILLRLVDKQ
jgi:hypothetical protein